MSEDSIHVGKRPDSYPDDEQLGSTGATYDKFDGSGGDRCGGCPREHRQGIPTQERERTRSLTHPTRSCRHTEPHAWICVRAYPHKIRRERRYVEFP